VVLLVSYPCLFQLLVSVINHGAFLPHRFNQGDFFVSIFTQMEVTEQARRQGLVCFLGFLQDGLVFRRLNVTRVRPSPCAKRNSTGAGSNAQCSSESSG
jgi:hypothetical protein